MKPCRDVHKFRSLRLKNMRVFSAKKSIKNLQNQPNMYNLFTRASVKHSKALLEID